MAQREYKLLPASDIDNFFGYDKAVAETHIDNCGYIVVDAQYGDVIDNEYDLDEIFYEIKNKPIKMTESQFKTFIKESVTSVLKEMGFKKRLNERASTRRVDIEIDTYYLNLGEEIEMALEEYPANVEAKVEFEKYPYRPATRETPAEGGYWEFVSCNVDRKGVFKSALTPEQYQIFVNKVEEYIYDYQNEIAEEYIDDDYGSF